MTLPAQRTEAWLLGSAGVLAVLMGVLAGIDGRLAIAGALAIAFLLVALADLTTALALFVLLGFVAASPLFGDQSAQDAVRLAISVPLILSWLAVMVRENGDEKTFVGAHPAIALLMVVFVSWTALSFLWAESGSEVMRSVLGYGLGAMLVMISFTAIRSQRDLVLVISAIVVGASISAAYGFLSPPSSDPGLQDRFTGTLGDPNYFAAVMVLGVALSGGLIAVAKTPISRGLASAAGLLCLIAIFPTASRGGFLALAAMLIAAVLLTRGRRLALSLVVLTVALVGIGYVFTAAPEENKDRILHPGGGSGRIDIWKVGSRMVSANPVTGVGAGNFEVSSIHYLLRPGSLPNDEYIADTPQVAHNTYLEVLAELGIPGAAMFLTLVLFGLGCSISAISRFRELQQTQLQSLTTAVAVGLIGLLSAYVFLSDEYSRPLWVMVGLGPALLAMAKRMQSDRPA